MTLERCWRFESDGVVGYVTGGGEHGVEITEAPDRTPATRRLCLNLEHYLAADRGLGEFVPRAKATVEADRTAPETVEIAVEPHGEWPVRTTLELTPRGERTIEARYEFSFDEAVSGFEAFVSNYFHEPTPPLVHLDGGWVGPDLDDDEHRFWASDGAAGRRIRSLYPEPYMGLEPTVADAELTRPVMVTPVPDSEWSVVLAADPDGCASLSANRRFNAHDVSLVGRDVEAGETVSARVWLWLTDADDPDATLRRFEELVADDAEAHPRDSI